ncbi:DNA modification methyltransferase [Anopheles sinensis]|uniref:DNA modification methyltransferase n=1 Tax=Anopheles sinensis TaxID=74873 RepID=A0A084WBW7_ANOSI|nr:DNA modification methyltransferase [Anopheles sinensis]
MCAAEIDKCINERTGGGDEMVDQVSQDSGRFGDRFRPDRSLSTHERHLTGVSYRPRYSRFPVFQPQAPTHGDNDKPLFACLDKTWIPGKRASVHPSRRHTQPLAIKPHSPDGPAEDTRAEPPLSNGFTVITRCTDTSTLLATIVFHPDGTPLGSTEQMVMNCLPVLTLLSLMLAARREKEITICK